MGKILKGCFTFGIIGWASLCFSQVELRSEIGFGLGTFNYTGDLVRSYDFRNSQPAATVFYRSNISKVISMRTSLTGGLLAAGDFNPIDLFAAKRASSFSIVMLEASAGFEYHFLDWRDTKRPLRFTPYIFAGAAMFIISGNPKKSAPYSNVQPAIPFGIGAKYVLNPNWYISLEFAIRKTFFDYLDNVSDGNVSQKNYQFGNTFDNDNYYLLGFSITRTLYNIPCAKSPY
jgi:hypothetical protein